MDMTVNNISTILRTTSDVLFFDGAMGTELEKRGVDVSNPLWSTIALLNNPSTIKEIHMDYLKSGSNILITSTYQTSIRGLIQYDKLYFSVKQNCDDVINKSVELANNAKIEYLQNQIQNQIQNQKTIKPLFIAGSIGPYGAFLSDGSEYTGNYGDISIGELKKFHYERLKLLILNKNCDFLILETMPNFLEIKVLTELIEVDLKQKLSVNKPYILSVSIKDPYHLADGTSISLVTDYLNNKNFFDDGNLISIGSNCLPLKNSVSFIKNLKNAIPDGFPISIYPNSGEIYDGVKKSWSPDSEILGKEKLDQYKLENISKTWVTNGARIIGGCCRVGPQDIKRIVSSF
ncbi:Homocysteine S-methyltransferase [Ascoidea rubescens DSM 1968]|uniref:Homocysteine S-methyltransferase n=1 Tax=Ascoidea rubescens DSM 1968 TaxID=1344418 RepID=A0A1D2VQV4_9ASCO|nr:Homocysteine S-methyltransferase [Ascoidea rubescens DSM 1968]ODV63980.1 Homocysteine S-methyltransferase [Ascoidea rubescens DSM 1968]